MVYSTGLPCIIDFSLYKGQANRELTTERLLLHPSTYGRELYDYISQHYLKPHDKFNLVLKCVEVIIDISYQKDKTLSEMGVDLSYDVDSNEDTKHTLFVTNPHSVSDVQMASWLFCEEKNYPSTDPNAEQDPCGHGCECIWVPEQNAPSSKETECQEEEPKRHDLPVTYRRFFNSNEYESETFDKSPTELVADEFEEGFVPCSDLGNTDKGHCSKRILGKVRHGRNYRFNVKYQYPDDDSTPWPRDRENSDYKSSVGKAEGYVGLVNQAMTCYLNSLLQALYMTPEFRNALYNWEYVDGSEKDEANSIPYQLQKVFLNLQTSPRTAVETTALTKSFGWDSTEAWQQHDIQELCRVMFDALERKFANTEQADLINRLYEGKMTDYVKCLECGTEKTREDAFLDIPLPVRPFGSNIAHNSVEEALRAFVQYETLEGANQYHCDKCNKKCDAHKGLKFTKFPYLLTLHLKRFDFDYKTFHRIKLCDKVIFPDILNLNSFISTTINQESPDSKEDLNFGSKCDDSSTTDSGTMNEDCAPFENSLSNSSHSINHDHDDDEGIDICNGPSTSSCSPQAQETENNRMNYDSTDGPYQYELFSILIHSGTAIGGHYYAYIKDFRTQKWLCFNDQNVTEITHDDIQKTYGGGPSRAYYSSASRSSTNAYMLMYRLIDSARNALPMQVEEFPKHIQELLKKMKEDEEQRGTWMKKDNDIKNNLLRKLVRVYKIQICYRDDAARPVTFYKLPNITLGYLTELAYERLCLDGIVSLDQCRLVSYDPLSELIIDSYEGREDELIGNIWPNPSGAIVLLMESRSKDETFQRYDERGIITKVYVVDTYKGEIIDGPINVRAALIQTVTEYKQMLGRKLNMDPNQMQIATYCIDSQYGPRKWPESYNVDLQGLDPSTPIKIFVSCVSDADSQAFYALRSKFENVISLKIQLPDVSKEKLEHLNIITVVEKPMEIERPILPKEAEKVITNNVQANSAAGNDSSRDSSKNCTARQQDITKRMRDVNLGDNEEEWNTPEQSNSEDSSLSDSDKTLVRDPPEEDDGYLSSRIKFHADDFHIWRCEMIKCEMKCDIDDDTEYYFKATPYTHNNQRWLKVLVDNTIKHNIFKNKLEHYVGVPAEYFNIYHLCDDEEPKWSLLLGIRTCVDGQKLIIKLKHVLRPDEGEVKLYTFKPDSRQPYKFLCDWVVSKEKTVRQTKIEIVEALEKNFGLSIPLDRCRLRIRYHDTPSRVLLDDLKLEEYFYCMGYEKMIAVQELKEPEPVTDPNQVIIFVRMYDPLINGLDEYEEIVLNEKTLEEVKQKISVISRIPEENIEIGKGKPFCLDDVSPTETYDWSSYSFEGCFVNGAVLVYRDSSVSVAGGEDLEDKVLGVLVDGGHSESSRHYQPRFPLRIDMEGILRPRQRDLRINHRTF